MLSCILSSTLYCKGSEQSPCTVMKLTDRTPTPFPPGQSKRAWVPHASRIVEGLRPLMQYGLSPVAGGAASSSSGATSRQGRPLQQDDGVAGSGSGGTQLMTTQPISASSSAVTGGGVAVKGRYAPPHLRGSAAAGVEAPSAPAAGSSRAPEGPDSDGESSAAGSGYGHASLPDRQVNAPHLWVSLPR